MMIQNYRIHEKETTVRVLNTEVSAVRKKDILRKAVRVIEDGKIGIAGSIGNRDDQTLLKEAKANLSINIPYPYEHEPVQKLSFKDRSCKVNAENIMSIVEEVLTFLKEDYPEFDFSEVAKYVEQKVTFTDSEGTELEYEDHYLDLGFILKEKALANLFDGFIAYQGRHFELETFIERTKEFLDAYKKPVDLPEEEVLPVMIMDSSIFHGKLVMELNGKRYGSGASLFSGRMNESLFHEKLQVVQDYNPLTAYRPFFDFEGVVNDDYICPMIKNGQLVNVFTNKKVAKDFNLEKTGSATGAYDDVPSLGGTRLKLLIDSENLSEKVKKAIMIVIAAGGDYTPDGAYATPVQKAFLYENGKIVGKLPEFQLKSNLYDMLGKDYIGTFKSPYYVEDHPQMTVAKMKIVKI